jgi:hypothetical protein
MPKPTPRSTSFTLLDALQILYAEAVNSPWRAVAEMYAFSIERLTNEKRGTR